MNELAIEPGDVVQINEHHARQGWTGAFVLVSEVKSWGVQGFVHMIQTHDKMARAYIRLPFEDVDRVGRAALVPRDEA